MINLFKCLALFIFFLPVFANSQTNQQSWIRINQLGYTPSGIKVAVWCSKENMNIQNFELINAVSKESVYSSNSGYSFGSYGPFKQSYRLNFSSFTKPGKYYLQAAGTKSPEFEIGEDVYKGTADFCLRYMRQQRCGYNPYLQDSCHTQDGYTLYGPMPDSTYVDVVGGWHDASDYLQYVTTSANATYHLLMAYRDYPDVFSDKKNAAGTDGSNGTPDVLDEARWGLQWLMRMHPKADWMFNQIADDRDHISMRIPKLDSQYGRGYQRPVYFVSGEPQQRGKFKNNTTGTSSTAAKFSSAFSLGSQLYKKLDNEFSKMLFAKASTAYAFALRKPGVTQTASVKSPYIYAEDNWVDDMELAEAARAALFNDIGSKNWRKWTKQNKLPVANLSKQNILDNAFEYAQKEPLTPWLGDDTAKHYQWYPFINVGHYEFLKQATGEQQKTVLAYYKKGIEAVWEKAKSNAFYRGIPYIWCSNNLTTAFAIQANWYNQLTNDDQFEELEQANIDWLFGCNPWGTSMVYGLPAWGDTPVDPHSAFTHLKNYPIDGGLVDGPVYGSIYNNLIGIRLYNPDEYADFQSDLVVYHDDYGDYSTNEPTMDGTASLVYLLAAKEAESKKISNEKKKK